VDPFLGELRLFGFGFAPRNWALCEGQLLPIASNSALFSLLGTTYGGNGQTTFALPDLRGRVPIAFGQGPGLSNYILGQAAGSETVTLLDNQIPGHNHAVQAASAATSKNPSGSIPALTPAGSSYGQTADLSMSPTMVSGGGGGGPHSNVQPYLTLNWCIALYGQFPSRS
jgi:microcystin-dependent protein